MENHYKLVKISWLHPHKMFFLDKIDKKVTSKQNILDENVGEKGIKL